MLRSKTEVALILNVPETEIDLMVEDGRLGKPFQFQGRILFWEADVRYVKQKQAKGGSGRKENRKGTTRPGTKGGPSPAVGSGGRRLLRGHRLVYTGDRRPGSGSEVE